jgi:ferredoxin--NADP+ reductase
MPQTQHAHRGADPATASAPPRPVTDGAPITAVTHWTESLFSFTVTRPAGFWFHSGEFAMIGLPDETGKPITRAYSIASPNWDDQLEFYSIIVPEGPLTMRLRHIRVGDHITLRPKATGTLVLDRLRPGKRLYMISSGTGIAPFASLIRDPETYERFDEVILTQACRTKAELAYGKHIVEATRAHPLIGDMASTSLRYVPTLTRDTATPDFPHTGRITDLLRAGSLSTILGLPAIDASSDRVMICGSIGLNQEIVDILRAAGLTEGSLNAPAEYVVERAFVGTEID